MRFCNFKKLFIVLFELTLIFTVLTVSVSAADYSKWDLSGWKKVEEDGETILKKTKYDTLNVLYMKGITRDNVIEFDIKVNKSDQNAQSDIGVAYKCNNGFQYFFGVRTHLNEIAVRRIGTDGTDSLLSTDDPLKLNTRQWYHFKIIFAENNIQWFIDDELIYTVNYTYDDKFTSGTMYIQGFHTQPTIKNITTSQVDVETVKKAETDLEFTNASSVEGFSAYNGAVSHKDGKLVYSVYGIGSSLMSPVIISNRGDKYSALLSVRNTVFVHMENKTSADKIKLSFITKKDGEYSDAKSKLFDIEPNSGYKSYYFNLSDLETADGYLSGFKLEPIGASSGEISIEAISFEREEKLYSYAGKLISCEARGDSITIKGELTKEHSGKKVALYETPVENYSNSLSKCSKLKSVDSDGTSFEITIPLYGQKISRLSSLFILATDEDEPVHITDIFAVENYRDYTTNPYSFELPNKEVKVTDAMYNAKGDGYTNDTPAIQKAIDDVSESGGGVVVIPGDDSEYGKRYIVSMVQLKDNVELRIEENAVLWQSPRLDDYPYQPVFGHDSTKNVVAEWSHAASVANYPLIYASGAKNIKLTGGGTIRCMDAGGDDVNIVAGPLAAGCGSRIHVVPIGLFKCENIQISDLNLRRTNNYHLNLRTCKNIYISNLSMLDVACTNSDGISATVGTKNMQVDRCFVFGNDDAITLCSTYDDPRGVAWWRAQPGEDNSIDNIEFKFCQVHGGKGLTFIPWGSDAPDMSKQEIKNIKVTQCVLGGFSSVDAHADNPFFGERNYSGQERDDYSPIKNIVITDNKYNSVTTLQWLTPTNIITDFGVKSASNFVNGTFERDDKVRNGVMGLSYWSDEIKESGSVSFGEENDNHFGIITGNASLFEGLYLNKGEYTFTVDTEFTNGRALLFVRDTLSGEIIATSPSSPTTELYKFALNFKLDKSKDVQIGVMYESSSSCSCKIDNAEILKGKIELPAYKGNVPETEESDITSSETISSIPDTKEEVEKLPETEDNYATEPKEFSAVPFVIGVAVALLLIVSIVFKATRK